MRDFLVIYERDYLAKLQSGRLVASMFTRYLLPFFAHIPLTAITPADIARWHTALGVEGHPLANACLKRFKAAMNWAILTGRHPGPNPCLGIKLYRETRRNIYVRQGAELTQFLEALNALPPLPNAYFWHLLTSLCRRDEARLLEWTALDLDGGRWINPQPKTNQPHPIPLLPDHVARLRTLPRRGRYLFSATGAVPWTKARVWEYFGMLRFRANLPHLRVHDLRRTGASYLAHSGVNIGVISKLLGHRSLSTTERYLAGLSDEPIQREAVEALGRVFTKHQAQDMQAVGL